MVTSGPYTPSELLLRRDPLIAHHQEEGRDAFATLLNAVGTGSFSGQAIDYLRTYLAIDKAMIAIFSRDAAAPPDMLFHNLFMASAGNLYLSYLEHHCLPAIFADEHFLDVPVAVIGELGGAGEAGFSRDFRVFLGMGSELRLAMPIDDQRIAVMLLGKEKWSEAEAELAVRCATFLRPTLLAHTRSRREMPGTGGGDWRMDHVRSSIGDDKLTGREFDIAMMILAGESTPAIAEKLDISVATVKVHRRHIYAKLNISCQAELFALAFRNVSF